MKFSVLLLFVLCFLNSLVYSQLQEDYPFKTFVDDYNNLYVTGTIEGMLFFTKFDGEGNFVADGYYPVSGFSKGMDIISSNYGSEIYVVGYKDDLFATSGSDIVIVKFTIGGSGGSVDWAKIYDYDGMDDKALSMVMDNNILYVTGYVTQSSDDSKDIVVLKVDPNEENPTVLWPLVSPTDGIDEIGTHILKDDYFMYIGGYKTQEDPNLHDMMMLSLSFNLEIEPEIDVFSQPSTNDYLTAIVLPDISDNSTQKSKVAWTGYSIHNNIIKNEETCSYLTVYFQPSTDPEDPSIEYLWHKHFGTSGETNIATAITSDDEDNVIVTGYFYNLANNSFDFGTKKYDWLDGFNTWDPVIVNVFGDGGKDQASSIKRDGNTNTVITAGYSESSTNKFVTHSIQDDPSGPSEKWSKNFVPDYLGSSNNYNKHYAETYILSDSSVLTFVASSNGTVFHYSAIRYDSAGTELYTIEEPGDQLTGRPHGELNTEPYSFELKQNYPNPFNPVTNISYTIPYNSFVELKIYDILGREIAVLVNNVQDAGSHTHRFDASSLPSGIYFYRLTATNGSNRLVKVDKMVLAK